MWLSGKPGKAHRNSPVLFLQLHVNLKLFQNKNCFLKKVLIHCYDNQSWKNCTKNDCAIGLFLSRTWQCLHSKPSPPPWPCSVHSLREAQWLLEQAAERRGLKGPQQAGPRMAASSLPLCPCRNALEYQDPAYSVRPGLHLPIGHALCTLGAVGVHAVLVWPWVSREDKWKWAPSYGFLLLPNHHSSLDGQRKFYQ